MNAYVDSSVILRIVLQEPDPLASWGRIERAVSSELVRLECLRTIDRARVRLRLEDADVARQRATVLAAIDGLDLVPVTSRVLDRAAEPFPTLLGSLDFIHLATALLIRDQFEDLAFATHDTELDLAARATGFAIA